MTYLITSTPLQVTMMFSDMVGYTAMSSTLHPQTVLVTLHSIFSVLDKVTTYLRVYKYETGEGGLVAELCVGHRLRKSTGADTD